MIQIYSFWSKIQFDPKAIFDLTSIGSIISIWSKTSIWSKIQFDPKFNLIQNSIWSKTSIGSNISISWSFLFCYQRSRLWYGVRVIPLMINTDSVIILPPVSTRLKRLDRTTTMVEDHGYMLNSVTRKFQRPPKPPIVFLRIIEVCSMDWDMDSPVTSKILKNWKLLLSSCCCAETFCSSSSICLCSVSLVAFPSLMAALYPLIVCFRIFHPCRAMYKSRTPGNNKLNKIIRSPNEPSIHTKIRIDGTNVNAALSVPQAMSLFLQLKVKEYGSDLFPN